MGLVSVSVPPLRFRLLPAPVMGPLNVPAPAVIVSAVPLLPLSPSVPEPLRLAMLCVAFCSVAAAPAAMESAPVPSARPRWCAVCRC